LQQAFPELILEPSDERKANCQVQSPSLSKNNQTAYKALAKKTTFPQISEALGHERVRFTLVGLFSVFTIAASFS